MTDATATWSNRTLAMYALARAWINHLDQGGKTTPSTIASYTNDLKTAVAFFGTEQLVSTIDRGSLERFNVCDGVMKLRSCEPKAQPTILKMRRAFRMALAWARENEVVAQVDKR